MHSLDPNINRDRSRRPDAKHCAMSRKAARREKVNRLFLAFAFSGPDHFTVEG